ncbi:hypothetical protein Q5752_001641 [Cryptotrichosporon argae]
MATCSAADTGLVVGCPPPSVDTLYTWLGVHGATVHAALAVVPDATGFGVRATADIPMGTQLLALPKPAMLSHRTTSLPPIPVPAEPDLAFSTLRLALVLLHELRQQHDSAFWGYLQILPRATPMVLPLWDELGGADGRAAAAWVKGTEAWRLLQDRAQQGLDVPGLRMFFDTHASHLPPTRAHPSAPTFRSFLHAYALVSTRAFTIDLYHHVALVPFADMLNHASAPHTSLAADDFVCHVCGSLAVCAHDVCGPAPALALVLAGAPTSTPAPPRLAHLTETQRTGIEAERDTVDMYAERGVGAGAEVCNTYGDGLDDARLLVEWGFAAHDYDGDGLTWRPDEVCPVPAALDAWAALDENALVDAHFPGGLHDGGMFARPSARPGILNLDNNGAVSARLFALVYTMVCVVSGAELTSEARLRADIVRAAWELEAASDAIERARQGEGEGEGEGGDGAPAADATRLSRLTALAARGVLALLTRRQRQMRPESSPGEIARLLDDVWKRDVDGAEHALLAVTLDYVAAERRLLDVAAGAWADIVNAAGRDAAAA